MPGKKWADMTPEEQQARKDALALGRANAKLNRIAKAKAQTENPIAPAIVAAPEVPAEAIAVQKLQVPGILIDASGESWTIPAESMDDDPRLYKSAFRIPNPDPDLYYQFEDEKDVGPMVLEGFRPVTLKEQGLSNEHVATEYGTVHDGLFRVHKQICLKIPKVLEQRRRRAEKKMVDDTLAQVGRNEKDGPADDRARVQVVRGDQRAAEINVKRPVHQSQGA